MAKEEDAEIMEVVVSHFKELLSAKDGKGGLKEFLEENISNKLSEVESRELDREVDLEEVKRVVKGLAKRKSSGIDAIPNDFFQKGWEWIKDDLVEVV